MAGHSSSIFSHIPTLDQIHEERARRAAREATQSSIHQYYSSAALFAKHCIQWPKGEEPTPYQYEAWDLLAENHRLSIRGPHGLGKTAIAAITIHWFALTREAAGQDWKIPTTASAWRQLTKYLWPEVHKWARRIKWWEVGRDPYDLRNELLTLELKLRNGKAFAVASDVPELIEGAHADQLLYIFDESKTIPAATFDAAEGAFSGGGQQGRASYALAVSTPGAAEGRFFEIQTRRPGFEDWCVRHVTLAEAIASGRVTQAWADQRAVQWGAESAIYKNRVLGEFADSEESGVIPLAWVEAAVERWYAWKEQDIIVTELTALGVDVARSGEDRSAFAYRSGWVTPAIKTTAKKDTMETAGTAKAILTRYGGQAVVDVIGIGAGVYDRLREQGMPVHAFNGAAKAVKLVDEKEVPLTDRSGELRFLNMRAAAHWHMREILDPRLGMNVALPPDDAEHFMWLLGDLTAPRWSVVSDGKIKIEDKESIKARLGRSPDCGDAVIQSYFLEKLYAEEIPWDLWSVDGADPRAEEESDIEQYVSTHGVFWPGGGNAGLSGL